MDSESDYSTMYDDFDSYRNFVGVAATRKLARGIMELIVLEQYYYACYVADEEDVYLSFDVEEDLDESMSYKQDDRLNRFYIEECEMEVEES